MQSTLNRRETAHRGWGPAVYLGYCNRTHRYRMMDAGDYLSNARESWSRMMTDMPRAMEGWFAPETETAPTRGRGHRGCGCDGHDCHCRCCVEDADVLTRARCGETRRISVTFENPTRRERPVSLDLGDFLTGGGRELGWPASLSETEFTVPPCGEHTVSLTVGVRCDNGATEAETKGRGKAAARTVGSVERCEVGYATIRAQGCSTRPVVVAVAVLPDDCDSYEHPCACDCCC